MVFEKVFCGESIASGLVEVVCVPHDGVVMRQSIESDDMVTVGVILAGGLGSRIGGKKPFQPLAGRPLIEHVIARLRSQVDEVVVCVGDLTSEFSGLNCHIVSHRPFRELGAWAPLAGVLAGLQWAHEKHGAALVVTAPCDMPFLQSDFVNRLIQARYANGSEIVWATQEDFVGDNALIDVAVWSTNVLNLLRDAIESHCVATTINSIRRDAKLFSFCRFQKHEYDSELGRNINPMTNVNTLQDLEMAEGMFTI